LFRTEALRCNPTATITGREIGAAAQPEPQFGSFSGSLDMFYHSPSGDSDMAATFAFRTPFSQKWPMFAGGAISWTRQYALPGTQPLAMRGQIGLRTLAPNGSVTLAPVLGCVKNFRIAGQDALGDLSDVGTTPTIVFDAPITGSANGYEILVWRLENSSGMTTRALAGRILTTGRSVTLPPGILSTGNAYAVVVRSRGAGSVDMNEHPRLVAFPQSSAETLSGTIRP
jgi:hypothetical protein